MWIYDLATEFCVGLISAIREVLINAYVHRDYSNFGRDIKIGIYDDALNVVSPGGLPNGLTTQDIQ